MDLTKVKYLSVNPTKHVKDIHAEHTTMLKKEIKEDLNK